MKGQTATDVDYTPSFCFHLKKIQWHLGYTKSSQEKRKKVELLSGLGAQKATVRDEDNNYIHRYQITSLLCCFKSQTPVFTSTFIANLCYGQW